MSEKFEITQDEIDRLIEDGVEKAKLEILINDFQNHKTGEETRWAEMFAVVRAFPEKVSSCKESLESDIYRELEEHYVTKKDMELLNEKLEGQIREMSNRFKWTVGVIVSIAGAVQFIVTMVYLTYQVSRILGN